MKLIFNGDKKGIFRRLCSVTQHAAIATLPYIGKNNKNEVDKSATDAMRKN